MCVPVGLPYFNFLKVGSTVVFVDVAGVDVEWHFVVGVGIGIR